MKRIVVGTAGHIDHGKTKLVEALTGIDCDRWAEEKERGITIDLGFAHLEEGDLQVGFIDVPGHERFLHNALAGLGGIRVMLLVVAADEGVKPQTREHLAICWLLGIPAGLVALTKIDLVTPDLLTLAQMEVQELLEATPYAGAPIVPISSQTGEGVEELRRILLDLAARQAAPPDPDLPTRLPIDRAFHLKGLGVVVTGTLVSGTIRPGETLTLLPARRAVRVRSVQVHGSPRQEATAGERTALQLSGAALEDLERGMQLVAGDALEPATSLAVRFRLLPEAPAPLKGPVSIRFHLYSSEVLGRLRPLGGQAIKPGETGVGEVRLDRPIAAARGDRFVIRRPSPPMTVGGGEILDPRWHRRRGKALQRALTALEGGLEEALLFWVEEAGEGGIGAGELARRLGASPGRVEVELAASTRKGLLLEVPPGHGHPRRWITPAAYQRVARRAERVLRDHFRRDRLSRGLAKAEAVERIFPGRAGELAAVYLTWLEAQGILVLRGDLADLPGRRAELTEEESHLAAQIVDRFSRAGLSPPAPTQLQEELRAKPQIVDGVVRYLVERGRLVRLPTGLLVGADTVEQVRRDLLESGWERFTVGEFKDRFGLTRKWAIPLLEYLDSTGATRRIGDERLVARPR